jgi:hypothetical protein
VVLRQLHQASTTRHSWQHAVDLAGKSPDKCGGFGPQVCPTPAAAAHTRNAGMPTLNAANNAATRVHAGVTCCNQVRKYTPRDANSAGNKQPQQHWTGIRFRCPRPHPHHCSMLGMPASSMAQQQLARHTHATQTPHHNSTTATTPRTRIVRLVEQRKKNRRQEHAWLSLLSRQQSRAM